MPIVSVANGGDDFEGKSGRRTANACETNMIETKAMAAAYFIGRGLIITHNEGKKFFRDCGKLGAPAGRLVQLLKGCGNDLTTEKVSAFDSLRSPGVNLAQRTTRSDRYLKVTIARTHSPARETHAGP
jgi:hypothetical protein